MICSACSRENPSTARFCNSCGSALEATCASCDQTNPPDAHFCNGCGTALRGDAPTSTPASPEAAAALAEAPRLSHATDPRSYTPKHLADRILTQKAALEGERKHVTVLFADVVESTALAQSLGDPELVHALLDRAFRVILRVVHGYEGTINQFTGDGVMALFGAPIALEDAPRRALVAAMAIHRALEAIDGDAQREYGRRFQMRIGIHTGLVVIGSIGDDLRMDYTAIGDTANLAARLESLARAGTTVVSSATRKQVEGLFDFVALPEATLKGISESISAFELVKARAATSRFDAQASDGGALTTYVGRRRELDSLRDAFEEASAGRGRVAFVVGEAGIGKSRLLHEFRRELGDEPVMWIEGRCASYAQTTPFYGVADSMRRMFGIDDRDDEEAALEKVDGLKSLSGDALDWTIPHIRGLLSLPTGSDEIDALDAMSRRSEMCRALHARVMHLSELATVVVVVEDLHWVDAATEEYLSYVADTIAAARVLIVMTHRPGYEHSMGDRSYHVRVPVQPLGGTAVSDMVGSVLGTKDLLAPVRDLIANKTEGNPLFIEEVTTSLLEEGVLALRDGRMTLTRSLDDVAIPNRIQDVLMARLDRLPEEPRRAIQLASVIGREFALRLLKRIHEASEDLTAIVSELRSLELIYEKASHPELAYIFKHALTHEVAYESLLVARRRGLHRIVGAAIEELYADRITEHYEALAHHFAESEDYERALRYHELASEKSEATYANHAAIEQSRRALLAAEHLDDVEPQRIFALYSRLGSCSWMTSDFGSSAAAFSRAAELAPNDEAAALLHAQAGFSALWNHDYDDCVSSVDTALDLADRTEGAERGRAFALMARDELELIHGRGLGDDSSISDMLPLAERSGDVSVIVRTLGHEAQRAEWRGDYRRAVEMGSRAVQLADEKGSPGDALFAAWFMGLAVTCLGDYARGLEVLGGGLAVCDRIGDSAIKARLLNTLGWVHAEFGSHSHAAVFNQQGTEIAREAVEMGLIAGAPELYANGAINLANNWIALGRLDDAAEQLAPIQDQYDNDPDPWMRWRWSVHLLHQKARLAFARGDLDGAMKLAQEELEAAGTSNSRKLVCRAHELTGRIELAMDSRESAGRSLARALALAQEIEHPSVAWRARGMLGELARREGDHAKAEREILQATATIETLANGVPADGRRQEFLALAAGLAADPFSTYR